MTQQARNRHTARQGHDHRTHVQRVAESTRNLQSTTTDVEIANDHSSNLLRSKHKRVMIPCINCGVTFNSKWRYVTCWKCMDAKRDKRKSGDDERLEMAILMLKITKRKKEIGAKW